jgi:hydroxymethylglutaryl-CoA reductase (NADPH)
MNVPHLVSCSDSAAAPADEVAGSARTGAAERWAALAAAPRLREALLDPSARESAGLYERNIENFIGSAKLPLGLVGPLRVAGTHAAGDYHLPLATTEATLVASYSRGAKLITAAGGCRSAVLAEGVSRSPAFVFASLDEACRFVAWIREAESAIDRVAATTTRFGKLIRIGTTVEGNHVYLDLVFTTGDAAGQNIATIATHAACRYILESSPVRPRRYFIESNHSGDKKASARSLFSVRGRRVSAEVTVPARLVRDCLHSEVADMCAYWRTAVIGGVLSGTVGVQGHYANGLAALFIACGQDVACVAEAAIGVTRFEADDNGDLYAAVTLPNVIVGTVGGGTGLPSQRACLELLGVTAAGGAAALAELCAALALAGELSIIGAICTDQFAAAHQRFARAPSRTLRP